MILNYIHPGKMVFINSMRRLEDILAMLSLWYDVDVIYVDESVKDLSFTSSGKMARYDNLMNLLKKFEYTNNVMFELNGKKLTVKKK